jgi:hypothetical protein
MNKLFILSILHILSSQALAQVDLVNDFDFSHCGYAANERSIPFVDAVYSIDPVQGDATELIQQAINKVSALPLDEDGFRGAVLFNNGEFKIYGKIIISTSGVVLRGSDKTVLIAAGNNRRTLIEVKGNGNVQQSKNVYKVKDAMVKPGFEKLSLDDVKGLNAGDNIFIIRPSTEKWIKYLKMDSFMGLFELRLNWAVGSRNIRWDREITRIEGHTIFFDGPITTELDTTFGQSYVVKYEWPGRITNVGIENIKCVSEYDNTNPKDEEHSWICINLSNVKDAWVRDVQAIHFAGSAVMIQNSAKNITVDNFRFIEPVSEVGGLRRISFYNGGQLNLIKSCYAENGRHDFVVGHCSAGPNVFLDCFAEDALNFSGSQESWACGALFDNITIIGNDIRLCNIKTYSQGAGYSASNCIVWNCNASQIDVSNPPGSSNYINGAVGRMVGDTKPVQPYKFYPTRSLFETQLENRLGKEKYKELATKVKFSDENPANFVFDSTKVNKPEIKKQPIEIINGRFVSGAKVFWSGHDGTEVWRGSLAPNQIGVQAALTRFVPGREGSHLTDNLQEVADSLLGQDRKLLAHRPGLWYDRRRADHQKIKRKDGNVWGPLLEMPWARSGIGTAWDGLSKFDLTKFNPWYFARIKEFADQCDEKQLLMYNEIYNNHNFIENGSHWVDFPWRPVNAVQNTGFTEPPPFTREAKNNYHYFIALTNEFYDVTNNDRRKLHAIYIRKYLDTLKDNQNVLHTIGFQYSGSLAFARFFFDTVIDWQNENNIILMWSIHTGKNVTDALLAEKKYLDVISVIDLRYWQYLEDGTLYAPEAGKNTAFRMYRRRFPNKRRPPSTMELLYKQIREYKDVYPDKALIGYVAGVGPLPILMAGGAYAIYQYDGLQASPKNNVFNDFVSTHLADFLWKMEPADYLVADSDKTWCMANPGNEYLFFSLYGAGVEATLEEGDYSYRWFSPEGKVLTDFKKVKIRDKLLMIPPDKKPLLLLVKKN